MIRHYLLTARRNLARHKITTIINLSGLSLGLASALLLLAFVYNQSLKDANLTDKERYLRLEALSSFMASEGYQPGVHPGIGEALVQNMPQVEHFVRIQASPTNLGLPGKAYRDSFLSERVMRTDASFFEFFPQQFIQGSASSAFSISNGVVITHSVAQRLFGDENPLGKQVSITPSDKTAHVVTAVVEDPPVHSSIQFGGIYANSFDYGLNSGGFTATTTYLKINNGADIDRLTEEINETIAARATGAYMQSLQYRTTTFDEAKYNLDISDNVIIPADRNLLVIFTMIALFILLLAVINYINLSTARALQRAQEAGIRKVLGAGRGSFFTQFVTESVVTSLVALPVAALLFNAALPYFETALEQPLAIDIMWVPLVSGALLLVLFTGLIAGIYPSLLISRFKFREFLSGGIMKGRNGSFQRSGLVVFQFAITLALVISALIVQKQLHFIQQQKLSYETEQVLVLDRGLTSQFPLLKTELSRISGVNRVSITSSPPGGDHHASSGPLEGVTDMVYLHKIDSDYASLLNLEFATGENFSHNTPASPGEGVLINETLAEMIKASNPQNLEAPLDGLYNFGTPGTPILGVIKDFHIQSMHEQIKPMVFCKESFAKFSGAYLMLEVETQDISTLLKEVRELWYEYVPRSAFGYTFMNDRFARLYTLETRLSLIFNVFTGIAVLISCMGLYGLIAFMTASRAKEVGIRKVMGASVNQIVRLFSMKVYGLILIAGLVAVPVAYWSMNQWLQSFAYHINITFDIFFWSVATVFAVGSLTVLFRIMQSAKANPVDTLRRE